MTRPARLKDISLLERCLGAKKFLVGGLTAMCDLGFFNSIDSQIPKLRPYDLDAFYAIVEKAHANYDGSCCSV